MLAAFATVNRATAEELGQTEALQLALEKLQLAGLQDQLLSALEQLLAAAQQQLQAHAAAEEFKLKLSSLNMS
ncbi:hypothetical protein OEZ86_007598 [Tetradesmus obliquus]|nr:hypothetical protein OEZ86_007598 [Tetradesmus obliquus]